MNIEFYHLKCCLKPGVQKQRPGRFLRSVFLLLSALLVSFSARATTYYIATNGNDSWTGTVSKFVSGTKGPWADFANINQGGSKSLQPGDVVYVEGGTYNHTSDSLETSLRILNISATQNNPVIISNYPGEYPVIYGSGPNNYAINFRNDCWVKLFGINVTNAYRAAAFTSVTNCEVAYCNIGGGDTNYGYTQPFIMDGSSQSNWVHNCTVHDALANPIGDSTHNMTFGLFYSTNDWTSYNIIESNICYHAGHDTLSIYGPHNLVLGNFVHNENWFFREDFQTNAAHRCMEVGGYLGYGNVIENNRLQYAGYNRNAPHGLEVDGPSDNIIRRNVLYHNNYSGLTIYGGKVASSMYWGSNYVYNNTIVDNGYGATYVTIYDADANPERTVNLTVWKPAVTIANSSDNFFANNLLWHNWNNEFVGENLPTSIAFLLTKNNLASSNPMFVNTNDGGPWSQTLPNFSLQSSSPAIDAGTWLTTITAPSGSGTSFHVANAGWFFAGMTAAGHTVAGDTIQLQGQTATTVITSISGNTITVNSPLTWTHGQGVALAYSGLAPDIGAYEFKTAPSITPPTSLVVSQSK